jgi:predicted permease
MRLNTSNETKPGSKQRGSNDLHGLEELWADIRYGLRSLLRHPGHSAVAVLSLAMGIGTTTAIFSLIYAVLIHPFPYAGSDRIMNPVISNDQNPLEQRWFPLYKSQFEIFRQAKSIDSVLGFRRVNTEITGGDLPEDVVAYYLTENADAFLGVRALLGRGIQPADAQRGGQPVVVLNYRFWQRYFAGDPRVIGRTLQLNNSTYAIVGVMPHRFAFNDTTGVGDVYLPMSLLRDSVNPPVRWFYLPWIKLKANISPEKADAELLSMIRQFAKETPGPYPKSFHLHLQPIVVPYERTTGRTLSLLFGAVTLLLVIGCVNCSILLLAKGEARRHELTVRSALGATRWRIVRQLLVESVVMSFISALLGVAASSWLAKLPLKLSPSSFPAESDIRINVPVLAFSVGLALTVGILFGIVPALRLSRPSLARATYVSLRNTTRNSMLNALIIGQIALTLLLLATAGTAIGAFLQLLKVPLGYDPRNVLQAGIVMHWNSPKDWDSIGSPQGRAAFINQMRQKLSTIPGVLSVAVGTYSTPPYSGIDRYFDILGKGNAVDQNTARVHLVSPEFFATLRIPLLRGRIWDQTENMRGDFVAVVNRSFAERYWQHKDPIGQEIRVSSLKAVAPLDTASPESNGWRQVIGVVGDVPNDGLDKPAVPAIYVPYTTLMSVNTQFELRTHGEPLAALHSVRAAVESIASDQQIANGAVDLEEQLDRDPQRSHDRLFSILFGVFSTMGLILALGGLFCVVSYSVAQKTAEFGVRMALGASKCHIVWIAMRVAIMSVLVGIAIGAGIDLCIHKILVESMNSRGPGLNMFAGVTLLLIVCAGAAALLPAWRAASISPVEALRYE